MNPYLKVLNFTLGSLRPYRYEEGWWLWEEELNMAKIDEKWEGIEEVNKTKL